MHHFVFLFLKFYFHLSLFLYFHCHNFSLYLFCLLGAISMYVQSSCFIFAFPFLPPIRELFLAVLISSIICRMNLTPSSICLCLMFRHILICFLHVEAADFSAKNHLRIFKYPLPPLF